MDVPTMQMWPVLIPLTSKDIGSCLSWASHLNETRVDKNLHLKTNSRKSSLSAGSDSNLRETQDNLHSKYTHPQTTAAVALSTPLIFQITVVHNDLENQWNTWFECRQWMKSSKFCIVIFKKIFTYKNNSFILVTQKFFLKGLAKKNSCIMSNERNTQMIWVNDELWLSASYHWASILNNQYYKLTALQYLQYASRKETIMTQISMS